ncbi:MAG: CHAT domain-containing protein [Moorea sp. SIO2B7]|nr:CHAT domain-containing protein [Moorena sp. SIO2B7]
MCGIRLVGWLGILVVLGLHSGAEAQLIRNIQPESRVIGRESRSIRDKVNELDSKINFVSELTANESQKAEADDLYAQCRQQIFEKKNYETAIQLCQQALNLYQLLQDTQGEGKALKDLGNAYYLSGNYNESLKYQEEALALAQRTSNSGLEAAALNNIGNVYKALGNIDEALNFYQKSAALAEAIGDRRVQEIGINNIRAIKQADKKAEADNFLQQGIEQYNVGKFREALQSWQAALEIYREIGDRPGESKSLNNLGNVYNSLGEYEKAISFYEQSLAMAREIGNSPTEAIILGNLGATYEYLKEDDKAIDYYQQSIEVREKIFADLTDKQFQTSLAAQNSNIYQSLINLLWDKGDYTVALNYIELAKARAFLNQVANKQIDIRQGTDQQLLAQEKTLRQKINPKKQQLSRLLRSGNHQQQVDTITNLQSEITSLEQDYSDFIRQLKRNHPETANFVTVNAASLSEIQALIPRDTSLVVYYVTSDRTLALIITRKQLTPITLSVTRQTLADLIDGVYEYDFANFQTDNLQRLHQHLIKSLQANLTHKKLIIVPHNILHYIPFAALTKDGTNYLIDNYTISSLPSASILPLLPKKRKAKTTSMLALGNPTFDLAYAEQEVIAISDLFKSKPHIGKNATESLIWKEGKQAGIIHLATHGKYNPQSPLFSTLSLAPGNGYDGALEVHEIYALDLTKATNLVVLSACETRQGQLSQGDELTGLNRAFIYAGTPSIIATLSNIDDEATAMLMRSFYQYLQEGKPKAEALRIAQNEVKVKYSHPYFWAAFVLTGDNQ